MKRHWLWEPMRAYWARKKLERMQYDAAAGLLRETAGPERVEEDPDAADWRPLGATSKDGDEADRDEIRNKARQLADCNPHARNILTLYRNYTVGTGMRHEVLARGGEWARGRGGEGEKTESAAEGSSFSHSPALPLSHSRLPDRVAILWREFLDANDWATGNRKDWEFCVRTWRDGECFLRIFRQATWPPRVHFIDPEQVGPDPQTGLPDGGIETMAGNVEVPVAYHIVSGDEMTSDECRMTNDRNQRHSSFGIRHSSLSERVEADRILHTKVGVDANVRRGLSIFLPVLNELKRFQSWLDVELIQRKMASSIVLVRKHQATPAAIETFADGLATSTGGRGDAALRRQKIQPGSIIDAQGFDVEFASPNTHFGDATLLGRMLLLSMAAGTGLPEYMLSGDASNANYSSTLAAEGPAMKHFAAWQAFFIGQWQKLFRMVMREAVFLGLLEAEEVAQIELEITPPELPSRNRLEEAQADAIYFDRGAISKRELARRDGVDAELMEKEREEEKSVVSGQ